MEIGFFRKSSSVILEKRNSLPKWLWFLVCTTFFLFWGCSAFRHFNFCSEAFDLGIFSQAVWLISNGESPISSLLHKHILGDHSALILYIISLIYKLFPTPYTLLGIQAFVLASTAIPTYLIAKTLSVSEHQAKTLSVLSVLHPTLFNSNFFDFHPDAIVAPGVLFAVYFAIKRKTWCFIATSILIILCKEIFSLVVIGLGVFFLLRKELRPYGVCAIFLGTALLFLMLWVVIPAYSPTGLPAGSERYFQFTGSPTDMIFFFLNNFLEIFYRAHWAEVLNYLKGLTLPILPAISLQGLLPLIGAMPIFILNSISNEQFQRNYSFHHSLPIVPFLILSCLYSSTIIRYRTKKIILPWSIGIFILLLAKGFYSLGTGYPFPWYRDTLIVGVYTKATSLISDTDSVIAPSHLTPHLTNRKNLSLFIDGHHEALREYNIIIVDTVRSGWGVNKKEASKYLSELELNQSFTQIYQDQGVYVFRRKV